MNNFKEYIRIGKVSDVDYEGGRVKVIYEDKGSVCFRLLDEQGAPLLFSEGYTAKRSCRMGIQSVGLNAPGAPVLVG